jgi:protein SCO1
MNPMPPAPPRLLQLTAIALCATLCAAAAWSARDLGANSEYRLAVWPQHNRSPEFSLMDFNRRPRSLADFRGRVVVVLFGFTRCPEICPGELSKLALVMKRLGPVGEHVQVLFISLDPEHDTPAALRSYVTAFDRRFIGLTGTVAQLNRAASGFSIEYARVAAGADYAIDHSTGAYVLDARGHLRLIGAPDSSIADFAHDLVALAKE